MTEPLAQKQSGNKGCFLFLVIFWTAATALVVHRYIEDRSKVQRYRQEKATVSNAESIGRLSGDEVVDVYLNFYVNRVPYGGTKTVRARTVSLVGNTVTISYDPANPNDFVIGYPWANPLYALVAVGSWLILAYGLALEYEPFRRLVPKALIPK